ncbi:MAG: xanthine dehydrogenase family protein molybdopterin-binding subunit [Chloroflexi bacterium]|nr:xanthine dehydrogenase family protein molybdopterin-binding subunit [Chloroflexota bacterium]
MVATQEYKVIGTRPIRHDGLDKVTGRAIYGADVKLPGMLYGAVLRSPHAHARIKSIDTSAAEAMAGVIAVMTAKDMPEAGDELVDLGEGAINFSHASDHIMAMNKAKFKGHPVAAVAAISTNVAREAVAAIKVDWEVLKSVVTVDEAMAPDAPAIVDGWVGDDLGEKSPLPNVGSHFRHEFGDIEKGFADSTTIIEHRYDLAMVHQGYIEPHNGTAIWDQDDRVRVWTSTQGSFTVRTQLAGVLQLDESRIKVIPTEIGGGFGGKIPIYVEPLAAILSKKSGGKPVRILMDRADVFEASGPTPGGWVSLKLGVNDDGKIIAGDADIRFDAGGFPGSPVGAAAMCMFSCYDIPNTRIDGWDIIVNKPKTAAYRAPGSTHVAYAIESIVDEICEKLNLDPVQFRLDNASKEGTRRGDGPIFPRIGNIETVEAARDSAHWNSPLDKNPGNGKVRGRGIASGYWFNVGLKSSVNLSVNTDGTVMLIEGSTDIGGSRTSIAMQAAEVLGISAEDVIPTVVDTDSVGYTDVTGGSRTTYATGFAAYKAAQSLIEELTTRASTIWDIPEDEVGFEDGKFSSKTDPELSMTFKELAGKLNETGGPVSSTGAVDLENAGGGFAVHICDLEIDPETGKTDVIRYTAVQDVGKAIHPSYVEGQMQGGSVQGIGWALNEEYFMNDDGQMANSSYLDYRMPTTLDLPEIETVLVEVPNPLHPFGVRGVGEPPIVPPVAAVANAIHDALGIRLRQAPMNPGRILEALKENNG